MLKVQFFTVNYDQILRISIVSKTTWRYLANMTAIESQLFVMQQTPCVQDMYDFAFEWF